MNRALIGMIAGMALAFAGFFGGFGAFLLVAALGALGYAAGAWLEGGGQTHGLRDMFERGRR
ncbi:MULTISPECIES: hypothetical protein [unclassified Streptomyces]|uniref:hypothetical protein n=1 Tax=unclassified Streptomyces TaxID=2593676 RepID=UPI000DC530B2|nr:MULTISPECIES: hypothetical protein [Streptomyces]MYU06845.1 hypothetical protein [Streptomyces sp. SID8366]MYU64695.1 hypothetical protein [Streptomyces sp. SID69]RAJ48896.1 hypothetical protein K376_06887 [Streptomyces sp. PsTaAH-130]TXJ79168.1 hypothetical protein E2C11_13135 [Streptomyces lavendulae]